MAFSWTFAAFSEVQNDKLDHSGNTVATITRFSAFSGVLVTATDAAATSEQMGRRISTISDGISSSAHLGPRRSRSFPERETAEHAFVLFLATVGSYTWWPLASGDCLQEPVASNRHEP